jgi:shikimate dehydrogenase
MDALNSLLARVRRKEIQGLNVTIPHKQTVIQFLDELTPTAKAIGAVNTVYFQDDQLIGDNTDAQGFRCDLKRFLTIETGRDRDSTALVLGSGGAARAIVYALLNDEWNVTLAARRMEQSQQLVNLFANYQLRITDNTLSNVDLFSITLIVNTTPVGMMPNTDQSPWPENLPFPPHAAIYDLVYNPRETNLVRDACSQGLSATIGLGMLIEQAALAFEIWTGQSPSREVMRACVEQSQIANS